MDTDSNAVSLYLDWNSTHLSLAWNGTDWQSVSEGADLFVYLNTSEDGGALSKDWGFSHTLPFLGDHAFVLEDSSYFRLLSWNGTSWAEGEQNGIETWIGWDENRTSEISIPLLNIGSPTSLGLLAWAQWQDAGNVWTSFPQQNPATANAALGILKALFPGRKRGAKSGSTRHSLSRNSKPLAVRTRFGGSNN